METNLAKADYILMVCTDRYATKADAGAGGVGYEKMIMTANLLTRIDASKVIPILRGAAWNSIPSFAKTKLYIDFSRDEEVEYSLDNLLRTLLKAPLFKKPELGSNPFQPLEQSRPDRTTENIRQVIEDITAAFEGTADEYVEYKKVVERTPLSRVNLDYFMAIAIDQELIARHPNYFTKVKLLPAGLAFVYQQSAK